VTATSTFAQDYQTLTTGCGLIDRSERGKLALTGAGTKEFLQGQLTNDTLSLTPGRGLYAAFLTQKGKMQGDVRVLDAGPELLLDTERVALQALFNLIRNFSLGYDVQLHKRTLESGLISLIGPASDAVLGEAGAEPLEAETPEAEPEAELPGDALPEAEQSLAELPEDALPEAEQSVAELPEAEHSHIGLTVAGAQVRAVRTDLGIDLLFSSEDRETVLGAVLGAGAVPVGEEAAECLRIESGRPRYGIDLDDSVIPQEAGLNERAVSFTKGCYVGQETVARLFYRGKPNRELRGLRGDEQLPVGTALSFADREVATVTSSAVSPRLGPVALALVRREAPVGSVVQAAGGLTAVVSALPFPNAS
jgi:folate-binding protein YgfZ